MRKSCVAFCKTTNARKAKGYISAVARLTRAEQLRKIAQPFLTIQSGAA